MPFNHPSALIYSLESPLCFWYFSVRYSYNCLLFIIDFSFLTFICQEMENRKNFWLKIITIKWLETQCILGVDRDWRNNLSYIISKLVHCVISCCMYKVLYMHGNWWVMDKNPTLLTMLTKHRMLHMILLSHTVGY